MSQFETQVLFGEAPRDERPVDVDLREIEAQLAYELSLQRIAHAQGQAALFGIGSDGTFYIPEEARI